jgi:small subunit ribosomal protein S17
MAQKQFTGVVKSAKRDKTITVVVTSRETHPIYKKQYTINRAYQAHDGNNEAGEGDTVTIEACRPLSKTKAFTLLRIDERSKGSVQLNEEVNAEVEDKADLDHADKAHKEDA